MGEHHYLEVALSQANSTMVGVPNDQWFFCQATQKPICWRCFHPWPFVSQKCDWRPWNHLMLQCVRGSSVVVTKLSISNHIESYHSSSKIAPFQPQLKMLMLNPEYIFLGPAWYQEETPSGCQLFSFYQYMKKIFQAVNIISIKNWISIVYWHIDFESWDSPFEVKS